MNITREMLQQRLDSLYSGRDQILAELHATSGAIQEVEFWLGQIEQVELVEPAKEETEKEQE